MERQLRAGGGIMGLEEPRQGYFLGKIVKKAKRAVKKVIKSPVGKAALTGALMFGVPGTQIGGLLGRASFGGAAPGIFGNTGGIGALLGQGGKFETLGNVFRVGGKEGAKFSIPRILGGVGAAGLIASPFLMGGEEEEEPETPFTQTPDSIANIVNQARNQDSSLRFLPKPKFVDNFYLADGGRAGYDNGGGVMMASNIENDAILQNLYEKFLDSGMSPADAEEAARKLFEQMSKQRDIPRTEAAGGGIMNAKRGFVDGPGSYAGKKGKRKPNAVEMTQFEENLPLYTVGMLSGAFAPYIPFLNFNEGGRVPAQEGGLMDLGGLEKDYREGGFVPLGAEERADDVPARLSKNEFVFTADAVRNAGGGDIDKGAEVMQNMMDNLEAGGTISEESQGMENPAQEMFDQSQMLENRLA